MGAGLEQEVVAQQAAATWVWVGPRRCEHVCFSPREEALFPREMTLEAPCQLPLAGFLPFSA